MSIIKKQEQLNNIKLLAAQRNLYSKSKRIMGFQMIISVPVAIIFTLIAIIKPDLKVYIACWAVSVILFDLFVLIPWSKRLRDNAARIQELFDTNVMCLEWCDIAVGKKPEPELIYAEATKHGLEERDIKGLRGWYPAAIDEVSNIQGIIICQRANVWWDCNIRKKYVVFIKAFLIFIAMILIGYGICSNKTLLEFLIYTIVPIAPIFIFGYRQVTDHNDAIKRLDQLRDSANKLWDEVKNGKEITLSKQQCKIRIFQNELFNHRRKTPPIFDFLFKFFRNKNEALMNNGAESIISELNRK